MEKKQIYDIELIIKKCDNIEDKKEFINYISQILKEKNNSFLYQIYAIKKKDFIVKTLEKTLKIMNDGGIEKNANKSESSKSKNEKEMRSIGGTFIHLVKTSDLISKDLLKKIFWRNKKKKELKRKLLKSFNKLSIDNNDEDKEKEKNINNGK